VVAQIVGGAAAILTLKALYPDVTPAQAADVVIPQVESRPRPRRSANRADQQVMTG
jgi:hypothetical protein